MPTNETPTNHIIMPLPIAGAGSGASAREVERGAEIKRHNYYYQLEV